MSDPYIQQLFADRIGGAAYGKGTEIYKFEKIKRAKRAALAANPGAELIDMGVGEPDSMAYPECVDALYAAAKKQENRGYADNGAADFQAAAARWLRDVCGVHVERPNEQIVHSIGSKAALSILPACFINPGDVALMTTPGYPVFGTHAKYLGGVVHNLPLLETNGFLPDLTAVPSDVLKRAKTLVINYPNNPTGASATPAFFEQVVAFAKRHDLVVIPRRRLRRPGVRRQAAQLPGHPRRDGRRRRAVQHEQGVQHDRLAAGLRGRQPAGRQGLRRREGQHRLGPIPGHPRGVLLRPGPPRADPGGSPPSTAGGWTGSSPC